MKQQKSKKGTRVLQKRTPKGNTVTHYEKEKPKASTCARCGSKLQGLPRALPSILKKLSRSKRQVGRKYGGTLCASCVKSLEKYKLRMEEEKGSIKRDLTIEKFLPNGWYGSIGAPKDDSKKKVEKKPQETSEAKKTTTKESSKKVATKTEEKPEKAPKTEKKSPEKAAKKSTKKAASKK